MGNVEASIIQENCLNTLMKGMWDHGFPVYRLMPILGIFLKFVLSVASSDGLKLRKSKAISTFIHNFSQGLLIKVESIASTFGCSFARCSEECNDDKLAPLVVALQNFNTEFIPLGVGYHEVVEDCKECLSHLIAVCHIQL
ncbi:hypothetical protein VNO78_17282 [Psophocarpus tetragonolobus]|uniref:Uncharacterized protein n=1 Tax=Psophocarpus tetragonolobus TaxID=3891 RepID=A0AAN9SGP5_PSOTE